MSRERLFLLNVKGSSLENLCFRMRLLRGRAGQNIMRRKELGFIFYTAIYTAEDTGGN